MRGLGRVAGIAGGVDVHVSALKFRSNDPVRPLLLAALRLPATRRSRKTFPSRNDGPAGSIERATAASRSLISCGVTVLAICYSATTGIVSDSYGYVSQADLLGAPNLFIPEPYVAQAPWPEPQTTFAPWATGRQVLEPGPMCRSIPPDYRYSWRPPGLLAAASSCSDRARVRRTAVVDDLRDRPASWIDTRRSCRVLAAGNEPAGIR